MILGTSVGPRARTPSMIAEQKKSSIILVAGGLASQTCVENIYVGIKVNPEKETKFFSSESSLTPKTRPKDTRAAVWLNFWCSIQLSA